MRGTRLRGVVVVLGVATLASRCGAGPQGGVHEGTPARVRARRRNEPPRLLMLLQQQPGHPVRLRIVVISDLLINTTDLDLDTAILAASTITKLVALASPGT